MGVGVMGSVVPLVSCSHQHTSPWVSAVPALVLFVGALPFGMAAEGGSCLQMAGVLSGKFSSAVLSLWLDSVIFHPLNGSVLPLCSELGGSTSSPKATVGQGALLQRGIQPT